jgi:hypothetical protein
MYNVGVRCGKCSHTCQPGFEVTSSFNDHIIGPPGSVIVRKSHLLLKEKKVKFIIEPIHSLIGKPRASSFSFLRR